MKSANATILNAVETVEVYCAVIMVSVDVIEPVSAMKDSVVISVNADQRQNVST